MSTEGIYAPVSEWPSSWDEEAREDLRRLRRAASYERYRVRHAPELRDRHAAKLSAIATIKVDAGCVDCGFDSHPEALDFDHRDPNTKSFSIGRRYRSPLEALLDEIDKCDVRCANCHRIKTMERLLS